MGLDGGYFPVMARQDSEWADGQGFLVEARGKPGRKASRLSAK